MRGLAPMELKGRLEGVMAFVPTPFREDGDLDTRALAQQVDYLAESRVSAIVVCGGVGEFYALEGGESVACMRAAVDAASRRLPVIAGIGHSTRIAVKLAASAFEAGVDGLMINPFYFVRPSISGVVLHYSHIAAAADLGIIIYSTSAMQYTPEEIEQICEIDAVIALKDETGDLVTFRRTASRLGSRMRWVNGMAEQQCVDYIAAGADAMTSGIVNLNAQFTLDLWKAARAGERDIVTSMLDDRARHLLELRARRSGLHIPVIKDGMKILGRPVGDARLPLMPLTDEEHDELRAALAEADFSAFA